MTADDINRVITDFTTATRRAVQAGFQVLEIHAAHGYLLHEFLSPLSNRRTDGYGGSLENRARLLLEIVDAVRAEAGENLAVFVRFSATDWVEDGWNPHDTSTVATWCAARGVDLFDISTGGNITGVAIPAAPSYQVTFSEQVKRTAEVLTAAVGLIHDAEVANEIITSGEADAVLLGREHMRDPHFTLRAASELGIEIDYWPEQYLRSRRRTPTVGRDAVKVAF